MSEEKEKWRRCFSLARDKSSSPYEYPENKKQLLVVSSNYRLLEALQKMAHREGAQLRHARPQTPDLIVFSASVRVVDRYYLGREHWQLFCDFLAEVNAEDEGGYTRRDEKGEMILEEPLFDAVPIIIVDEEGSRGGEGFPSPESARGEVLYISQHAGEIVVRAARRLLRQSDIRVSPVRAERAEEVKKREEGKLGKRLL